MVNKKKSYKAAYNTMFKAPHKKAIMFDEVCEAILKDCKVVDGFGQGETDHHYVANGIERTLTIKKGLVDGKESLIRKLLGVGSYVTWGKGGYYDVDSQKLDDLALDLKVGRYGELREVITRRFGEHLASDMIPVGKKLSHFTDDMIRAVKISCELLQEGYAESFHDRLKLKKVSNKQDGTIKVSFDLAHKPGHFSNPSNTISILVKDNFTQYIFNTHGYNPKRISQAVKTPEASFFALAEAGIIIPSANIESPEQKAGWRVKYHQQQKMVAGELVYEELKKHDADANYSLNQVFASAIEAISENNICLSSSDIASLQKGLRHALNKLNNGKYEKNCIGRGILSLPSSAVLEEFDKYIDTCFKEAVTCAELSLA